ncbi:MAG: hypothetical protein QM602_02845 [Microbacterium sp.]
MTTTLAAAPVSPASPQAPRDSSAAARVVAVLAIVLGALVVLGTAFSAVGSTVASSLVHTETRSLAGARFDALDVDLQAGSLAVVFVEGQDAPELEVTGRAGADDWTISVDEGTLHVASPDGPFGPGWWFGGAGRAVLRLPATAQGALGADFDVSAGRLTVSGDIADLDVTLSAGSAKLVVGDVRTATLAVSAGALTSRFTGSQPTSIVADVSAGSLTMRVPDGAYDIRSDVSAGGFDSRVASTPGASSTIDVQLSAGHVTLR